MPHQVCLPRLRTARACMTSWSSSSMPDCLPWRSLGQPYHCLRNISDSRTVVLLTQVGEPICFSVLECNREYSCNPLEKGVLVWRDRMRYGCQLSLAQVISLSDLKKSHEGARRANPQRMGSKKMSSAEDYVEVYSVRQEYLFGESHMKRL